MKKTVTYLALAATSVLFLTACSNNNQESTNTSSSSSSSASSSSVATGGGFVTYFRWKSDYSWRWWCFGGNSIRQNAYHV